MTVQIILAIVLGICSGVGLGFLVRKKFIEDRTENLEAQGRKLIENALAEAEQLKKEAVLQSKDEAFALRQEAERDIKALKKDVLEEEKKFIQKLEQIEKKMEFLDKREMDFLKKEQSFSREEEALARRQKEVDLVIEEQRVQLEKISGISREEAKKELTDSIESEARMEAAKMVVKIENEMKITADKKAKDIIALAISRYAGDYVAEKTVSVVPLPNEEMKGRIIGREGRNIRALEAATGVDIIIDDTPEAVILSAFNPVRREVARRSLERLISDGRIHPGRIEEIVEKVTQELEVNIREAGEEAAFDAGVHGLHPELVKLLGKLKFRTSYAQNVLQHSVEVCYLCGIMAAELGLNVKHAKRAGLLHDIGKAVDQEAEGVHALIGADLAKRHGESPKVVHAVGAHHEDIPPENILAVLVQAADTLSGARPGARREMLETYVKRLEELERVALSFGGISKSYAIQAGREIRLIVESEKVNDEEAALLSREVAKKIEQDLTYPGQIKVTVIRETRSVEYAR